MIRLDVRDPQDVSRAFEQVERELGVPDILVNNAGISGEVGERRG
ncbi:hypothetical protein DAETH_15180 [Deinococcus aetherius]|uniref:3-oxoacyl-[acyl-carrier protein] reductase n=1 Tax=Deinococcus aetherius TaxID=200252 RepID=A0ABN6RI48_9DEIO|nr:hypothetical protein DAETH_15180 [Deinococcus aetherius]